MPKREGSGLLDRLVPGLLRRKLLLSLLWLALLLGSILALPGLRSDLSILPLLQGEAQGVAAAREFDRILPPRRFDVVCLLTWPRPLGAAELAVVDQLQQDLSALPGARYCFGLGDVQRILPGPELVPRTRSLAEDVGEGMVLDAVRDRPLLAGRLLSEDGRTAALLVRAVSGQDGDLDPEFTPGVRAFLHQRAPDGVEVRLLGRGPVEEALKATMRGDILRVLLAQCLVLALLLPLLFRSVRGVVVPLGVVLVSLCLDAGVMAVLDWPFTIVDTSIPGLITIIGMCDAVHLVHRFEECFERQQDRTRALIETLRGVGPACIATSSTTALGFLSLLVASHPAVRDFGLKAALGVMLALVSVLGLVPLAFAWWPLRRPVHPWSGLRRLGYGRLRLTLAAAAVVLLMSALGATRAQVDSHWLEEFDAEHPVARDLAWYEEHFGGLLQIEVRVEADHRDPDQLAALDRLRQRILTEPGVTGVESFRDWLEEASGRPEFLDGPAVRRGWARLSAAGAAFPEHVLDAEGRVGRLVFRTVDFGTDRFFELERAVQAAALLLPDGMSARVEGAAHVAHASNRLVVTTMFESFLVSLLTITAFLALVFRSLRLGLLSLLANLLPGLVGLGLTGWLGIPLRVGIAMIFSLGLGLAVDDTIHLISRYREELRSGQDARAAASRAVRGTGGALVMTSLVLVAGSLCALASDFRSMRDVAVLLGAMVLTALATDLWLLPHLLERFGQPSGSRRGGQSV